MPKKKTSPRPKARPSRKAAGPKAARSPRTKDSYVWVKTEEGVQWFDSKDGQLPDPQQVLEEKEKKKRAAAEKARRKAELAKPIRVKCPECGLRIAVPRTKAGKKGHCPSCGTAMIVPEAPPAKRAAYLECLECGALQAAGPGNCDECGKPLPQEKRCTHCGDVLVRPGVEFCPDCGFELAAPPPD